MNALQFVERVVRIVRVTDITLDWMPTYEGQQLENIRRYLWWYCNLAYVFVITERIIATVNFSDYERWGLATSFYVIISSYISGGAFYYVSQFVSDNFTQLAMKVICVTLPWLALHICERINVDLSSNILNLSLSARFQISENISTLVAIKGWICVSAIMNVCISCIMCIIWYVITPNHLLYGLHVISNMFDLVIALYVFVYPIIILYINKTMRNMVIRIFIKKKEEQIFHKKNAVGITPTSLYPPTSDEYFRVLNERWNLFSNPQPKRKWFNFQTAPKWIRVLHSNMAMDRNAVARWQTELDDLSGRLNTLSWMLTALCVAFSIYSVLEIATMLYTIVIKRKKCREKEKKSDSLKRKRQKKGKKGSKSGKAKKAGKSSRKKSRTSSSKTSDGMTTTKTESSKKKKSAMNAKGDRQTKAGKPIKPIITSRSQELLQKENVPPKIETPKTTPMDTPTSGVVTAALPTPEMIQTNEMMKATLPAAHITKEPSPVNSLIVDNSKLAPVDGSVIAKPESVPLNQSTPISAQNAGSTNSVAPTQTGCTFTGSSTSQVSGISSHSITTPTYPTSNLPSNPRQSTPPVVNLVPPQPIGQLPPGPQLPSATPPAPQGTPPSNTQPSF
ncbi:unnamed protein product [Bursaphelenchus xylophilus]|uniref:(pine wood nematode) hypothetical protein n=1 Tax=Bursaphelenchus xylophilus TaxID=6326 RepID=A0A1I7S963_BURXY|nr:unnamed protein product [Bursaphelenchus xylophilus]CAG9086331.1 unnamed protein product [Bursaphelenchus xylophilus]